MPPPVHHDIMIARFDKAAKDEVEAEELAGELAVDTSGFHFFDKDTGLSIGHPEGASAAGSPTPQVGARTPTPALPGEGSFSVSTTTGSTTTAGRSAPRSRDRLEARANASPTLDGPVLIVIGQRTRHARMPTPRGDTSGRSAAQVTGGVCP
jgi:hypothetical protein